MAGNKTTIIKAKKKAISSRAKARARNKVVAKKVAKPKSNAKKRIEKAPPSRPRSRNAIGAIREVVVAPMQVQGSENAASLRRVAIDRALYDNKSADYDAPWVQACLDEPTQEDTSRNRGRMLGAILVATLVLGVFNSGALVNRVRGLSAGPIEDRIISASEIWHEWMEAQELGDYVIYVRKYIQDLKETGW